MIGLLFAAQPQSSAASTPSPADDLACSLAFAEPEQPALAFRSCGQGSVVLLIPGGPGLDASYMQILAQDVARAGYRAVLLEPRGTGASAAALTSTRQLTVAGSIADLEVIRETIGADRVMIIGHSFGGAVAQAYAAAHPDRVSRIVLLDSVGLSFARPSEPLDAWRQHVTAAELARYDEARAKGDRIGAMKIKFRASFYDRRKADAFIGWLGDSTVSLALAPLSADYEQNYDVSAAARIAPYEVVLIVGDMDWIRGYERQMLETYPKLRRYIVPRAGHFPWLDDRRATRTALKKALRPSK